MEELIQFIKQFVRTLGTLVQAQSILCLIFASWIFTSTWVFTSERKKRDHSLGISLLGLFWLPGLAIYYLIRQVLVDNEKLEPQTPYTLQRQTSETQTVPSPSPVDEIITFQANGSDEPSGDSQPSASNAITHQIPKLDPEPSRPESRLPQFKLEILDGQLKGQVYEFEGKYVSIGSHSNNNLQLDGDATVQRWHAEIKLNKMSEFEFRRLGNEAGHITMVNGQSTKLKQLVDKDEILLGNTRLRFVRCK